MNALVKYLAFILLTGAVVYLWYFRKPVEKVTYIETTVYQNEAPVNRLSAFVDAHADSIFAPLSATTTVMPTQEIRQIRETLRGMIPHADANKKSLYSAGFQLADQLLVSIDAREKHCRRLADSLAKKPVSIADKHLAGDEIKKKSEFFQSAIQKSWDSEATRLRDEIDKQYSYIRLLEK
ncbi:MAG: hypothetical protein ACOYM3_03390 [Terrimicrobiaceae bacterium]